MAPFTNITKKDQFKLTEAAKNAFQQMMKVMMFNPILPLPSFSRPLVVECDASGTDIRVVLKQNQWAITFERR